MSISRVTLSAAALLTAGFPAIACHPAGAPPAAPEPAPYSGDDGGGAQEGDPPLQPDEGPVEPMSSTPSSDSAGPGGDSTERDPPPAEDGTSAAPPPIDVGTTWSASGWMGCGEFGEPFVNFTQNWRTNPKSPPACIKIRTEPCPGKPADKRSFAGIYWLYRPNDWHKGADLTGYSKLTFWARGETGTEMVEFKIGGQDDSDTRTIGETPLEKAWKQYAIDLSGMDLKHIAGGFAWVTSMKNNPSGATFYLDDVRIE